MGKEENSITIDVDIKGIDEALEKAQKINELLEEARTIINELASKDLSEVNIEV